MRTLNVVTPSTVFIKTSKGREEILQRRHKLNPSQRRMLIVVDGNKSFEQLVALIPAIIAAHELEQTVSFLLQQEFIAAAEERVKQPKLVVFDSSPTTPSQSNKAVSHHVAPVLTLTSSISSTASTRSEPLLTQDPAILRQAKDFMAMTAQTYLGLLSAEVIQRIERAKDAAQLMSVVGHWHMALRASKQGSRFAGASVEQVKLTLTGSKSILNDDYRMAQQ